MREVSSSINMKIGVIYRGLTYARHFQTVNDGFPSSTHPTNILTTPPNTAHDGQNDPP